MNNLKIIAFAGFIGCGKSAATNFLVEDHGYQAFAFADVLKDVVSSLFVWPRDMVEGKTQESREWREQVDPYWARSLGIPHLTPRWALQHIGTSVMRQHFHEDVWVHALGKRLAMLPAGAKIVVTDARFKNELDVIRNMGGKIYRVRRGKDPYWFDDAKASGSDPDALLRMLASGVHESEWRWINYHFDGVIENDGSLDELRQLIPLLD